MNFDSSLLPVSQNFLPRGPKKDSKVCECLSSESFPFHRYINLKGKQRARAAATSGTLGVWPGSPPAHRTAERGDGRERRRERDAVYWFPRYHVSSQNSKCLRSINSTPLFWPLKTLTPRQKDHKHSSDNQCVRSICNILIFKSHDTGANQLCLCLRPYEADVYKAVYTRAG